MRHHCCVFKRFHLAATFIVWIAAAVCSSVAATVALAADETLNMTFKGVLSEHKYSVLELGSDFPTDWSDYTHLVMEMRTTSPQRFALWVYTDDGPRRIEIQPFGQNVWLRASIPLQYFKSMDQSGSDLASTINRRTPSFWMSVWGPFGSLKSVKIIGFAMDYPLGKPTVEIRKIHLVKRDEGSEFLEGQPVVDSFGQWAHVDWPRKIKSKEQLDAEMAKEAQNFGTLADFGFDRYGGAVKSTAKASGFFRVEQTGGQWWFVDPEGRLFLSTGINGTPGSIGRGGPARGRTGDGGASAARGDAAAAQNLTNRRLDSWGMTTGGAGRPNLVFLNWPRSRTTTFLGLPDVYSDDFARGVDDAAKAQCEPRKDDPLVIGYFIGNEPPWGDRETEVVDMILAGPDSATKGKLQKFLADGDTPKRRKAFVIAAFEKYLDLICTAVRKYDPNHLNLGIRFGGKPADEVLRAGRVFDVCSINVYEYEPTKQIERAYRLTGRPILIGEFHLGVPENGLGAGLVQAKDQAQRAAGYRYYVEQAASLPEFVGASWFQWRDEPVLGRMDGENYNIGFVDATDRPYPELVEAAKTTNKRLFDVHSGKAAAFATRPDASDAGTPSSPWDN
ncbi:MAG TPA: hypothetical protein VGJ15_02230 [Pirellulales bacterium]